MESQEGRRLVGVRVWSRGGGSWDWNSDLNFWSGPHPFLTTLGRESRKLLSHVRLLSTKGTPQGRLVHILLVVIHLLVCLLSGRGFVGINEINGLDFSKRKKHLLCTKQHCEMA
jgi:hypothetical protein